MWEAPEMVRAREKHQPVRCLRAAVRAVQGRASVDLAEELRRLQVCSLSLRGGECAGGLGESAGEAVGPGV